MQKVPAKSSTLGWRAQARYLGTLLVVALAYFGLAKLGLQLASINPSASPIWPPTGLALAAVLLGGLRMWPAIVIGAFAANVTTAGTPATAAIIALGNTLEALAGGYLIGRWSGGRDTFMSPWRVAKFALVAVGPASVISATVGVLTLSVAGLAAWTKFTPIWVTWWLGDAAGALVVTPVIVLWAQSEWRAFDRRELGAVTVSLLSAVAVGLIAFSPLLPRSEYTSPLGFLAILPLLWAALRRGPRDTATVGLILTGCAIWGRIEQAGPFGNIGLNESFLLLLTFMISVSVPSLALSVDVAMRRRTEDKLRRTQFDLDQRVKERTAALAEANIHLTEAQRLANLGNWRWDVLENTISWSDQLMAIYGLRPGQFKGTLQEFIGFIHPDDRAQVRASVSAALKSGKEFSHEERIIRPDGSIRYLHSVGEVIRDERGAAVRLLGICQDVTERKEAERALHDSEQNYRLLLRGARDYAIYMLDVEGRVRSWNDGARRLKGYEADEILGRHFRIFLPQEVRAGDMADDALVTAAREGQFEAETWLVRKDGSRFYASVVMDAIRNDAGELIGFAKLTRDITTQHEAQIALEQAREQVAQAQKMEALGQLTGGIAHDFNNLLMIVSGYAQILQSRLSEQKDMQAVEAIRAAANRGERLTRQLLAFSRRQQLTPVVVDLRQRIDAVRDMLVPSLRGNIELICDIEDKIWPVEVDLGELELALVNIAVNARDAMPDGGTITLVGAQRGAQAWFGGRQPGRRIRRARRHRHRQRHAAGGAAAGVRAVLHHQAGRQGHRAWLVAGARLRQPVGRRGDGEQRAGPRHRGHDLSAAQRHCGGGECRRRRCRERRGDPWHRAGGGGQPRRCRRDVRLARAARLPRGAGRKCRRGAAPSATRHRRRSVAVGYRHAGRDQRPRACANSAGSASPTYRCCSPAASATPRRPPTGASIYCASRSNWPRWRTRSTSF